MPLLANYLLITFRNLLSNRLFSIINIFGLSVGLACVILITLFVNYETSYDRQWEKSDRTYRVMRTFMPPGGRPELNLATNAPLVGPLLKQNFPEFEQVVRILNGGQTIVAHPDNKQPYYEDGINFVDPEIFRSLISLCCKVIGTLHWKRPLKWLSMKLWRVNISGMKIL